MSGHQEATMSNFRPLAAVFVFACSFLIGCKEETALPVWSSYPDRIAGEWHLKEGYRNGEKTGMLGGLYFVFDRKLMNTNLPLGDPGDNPGLQTEYELVADSLFFSHPLLQKTPFRITMLDSLTLDMEAVLLQQEFRFLCSRVVAE